MMIDEYYIYSRWEKMTSIVTTQEEYEGKQSRIEALTLKSHNHVFISDNIEGNKKVYIAFEEPELNNYVPIQINGLEISLTKNIQISQNELFLCISLVDVSLEEAFLAFTASIILRIHNINDSFEVVKTIEKTIKAYSDFFSKKAINKVTEIQEQGLFAELSELEFLMENNGEEIILCWEGPERRRRDFILSNLEIEIKSSMKINDRLVTITSENQLEPADLPLYLHLYVLEKLQGGKSVIDIIEQIFANVISVSVKKAFVGKLFLLGINKDTYNPLNSYRIVECIEYLIDDSFPRVRRENIPNEIYDVRYKLDLKMVKGVSIHNDKI